MFFGYGGSSSTGPTAHKETESSPAEAVSSPPPLAVTPPPAAPIPPPHPAYQPTLNPYPTLTLLLLPTLFLIPYLTLRRRLVHLAKYTTALGEQHEIAVRHNALWRDREGVSLRKVVEDVEGARRELDGVRREMRKDGARRDGEVRKVVEEVRMGRGAVRLTPQTIEEISSSFVDVAAFIEEMEVMEGLERRGLDPRGIEKMRRLAMNLHAMAVESQEGSSRVVENKK